MKQPSGPAPRRTATPRKKVRLDLKRSPAPPADEGLGTRPKSNFWKWVLLVAFFHVLVIGILSAIYEWNPAPKPPEQFMSLLPPGQIVKGTTGAQKAHKIGATTAAAHHTPVAPPTPVTPVQPTPVKPPPPLKAVEPPKPVKPVHLKPIIKADAPPLVEDKPKPPVKPKPPKVKVKVDLTKLEDAPDSTTPPAKAKPHPKKPPAKPAHDDTDNPDSTGMSREEIARELGKKMEAQGVKNSTNLGDSGAADSHASRFAEFYASIRDQAMNAWQIPNLADATAVDPVVHIHVEKSGYVPPDSVRLIQSSGNATYDDSAVAAAKGLGNLHEPLPDGCPPDISITFKPNR
jgi:outer membrane biosynthesis protein TonB